MLNCYLVKIPFATKGEIKKNSNSLKITGYANYIYDFENKVIIHEYLELTKANYRLTDKGMIKPTAYYLNPSIKNFRNNILDKITNHNPLDILSTKFNDLNQENIKLINKYLKNEKTTIKKQFSYFQGSNISGANSNSKASPLLCIEQEYFKCNFANPMKKIKGKLNLNYEITKNISLVELMKDNDFKNIFKESNIWYFNDLSVDYPKYSKDLSHSYPDEIYSENNFNNWKWPKDLDEKISDYIDAYLNGILKENDMKIHKRMLRTFFGSSVRRELDNKKIPYCSMKEKVPSEIIENAHIIKFSKLVSLNTKESLLKAVSPFNVLRIDSNHHKLFDNNKITFDSKGNKIFNDSKDIIQFLDIDILPKETINFIEENYEYWNTYKINK